MKVERDPLAELKRIVATHETQAAAADALEISESYLSDLLAARRDFSDKMLEKLGLRRAIVRAS